MSHVNNTYQHILVGLDLTETSPHVLNKAVQLAHNIGAQLSVAHVIEPVSFAYGGDMPVDVSEIQEQQLQSAENDLQQLLKNLDIPILRHYILVGNTANELHNLAQQQKVDLIIVGSHGRKGFALLLGSTPNSVLHGATCDILAVLVKENES